MWSHFKIFVYHIIHVAGTFFQGPICQSFQVAKILPRCMTASSVDCQHFSQLPQNIGLQHCLVAPGGSLARPLSEGPAARDYTLVNTRTIHRVHQ